MTSTFKTLISLIAVLGLLAGCSSNTQQDQTDTSADNNDSQVVDTPDTIEEPRDPMDDLRGVDTVFYFDFDQSILKSSARAALTVYAEVLKEVPSASVRLEGHADERGSREYNMALGERRANAVRDYLVLQGVDSSIIETVSYGEERPAEVGSYDSAWSKNRRVEISVSR